MNKIIKIDDINIEVIVKKVKNINLRINKEAKVIVSINKRVKDKYLINFLESHIDWVKNGINKVKEYNKKEKQDFLILEDGKSISIFERKYILKFVISTKRECKIDGAHLIIKVKDINNVNEKQRTLDSHLTKILVGEIDKSIDIILEKLKKYNISKPRFSVRKMKTRWGTCNISKKKLTINFELIKYERSCLDYVVLHELVHFVEKGHNKRFYSYILEVMPEYKGYKKVLSEL